MNPPEEIKRNLVDQWIAKADQDIRASERLLYPEPSFPYPVCFHAQQAAEKYLKAFLTWHQVEFPKTHSIGQLLDLIQDIDADLAKSLDHVTPLTPYGVEIRYPGDLPELNDEDAKEAIALAYW